ncbi:hypothetical protein Tco_1368304 [Tanacetum coccineum]
MDDPNITMEDYIRLEEEKALRRGTVYNWETAKYGKIWYDEDVHDLRSVETELYSSSLLIEAFTSECAGDVVNFRTWPGILFETSMMSTMDLDGVTCLTVIMESLVEEEAKSNSKA